VAGGVGWKVTKDSDVGAKIGEGMARGIVASRGRKGTAVVKRSEGWRFKKKEGTESSVKARGEGGDKLDQSPGG